MLYSMSFNYTFRYFDTNLEVTSYTVTTEDVFPANITDVDPASITLVDGPIVQQDVIITGNSLFEGGTSFTGTVDMSAASVNLSLSELRDVTLTTGIGKGDLFVYSGSSWNSLPVGNDNQLLVATTTATLGLEWKNSDKVAFDAYDNTGGQTVSSTAITLNLDTIRTTSSFISLASDEVTVNKADTYNVIYRVSTENTTAAGIFSTNRARTRCWLQVDTGSGYSDVPGSFGYIFNNQANTATGSNTATINLVIAISDGDKFRIRLDKAEGGVNAVTTIAEASGITFSAVLGSGADGAQGPQGPAGSGSTITVKDDGTAVTGSPFDTLNFENGTVAQDGSILTQVNIDLSYTNGIRHYGALSSDPVPGGGIPSPNAGDQYYNTTINHDMRYDVSRSKWLSVATFMDGAGRNGTVTASTFYRRWNGMVLAAAQGPPIPTCTIVRIGYSTSTAVTHTYEVLVGGVVIASLASGGAASATDDTVNADASAGILSSRNAAGSSTTTNLQSVIYYKLRSP